MVTFLFFFDLGCRKDKLDLFSLDKTFIEEAKSFFSDSILNNPSVNSAGILNLSDSLKSIKKKPVWGKAKLETISLGKAIVVPLSYETILFGSRNQSNSERISIEEIAKLLMYKDLNGKFKVELVNFFPDGNFIAGSSNAFSGIITVQKWNGDFVKGFKYLQNEIRSLKQIQGVIKNTAGVEPNYIQDPQRYCYWEDWYRCYAINNCTLITSIFLGCDDGNPTPPSPGSTGAGDYQYIYTPTPTTTPCPVSIEDMKAAFPTASISKLNTIVSIINKYSGTFGLDTKAKVQMFLAQAAHETASFAYTNKQENLYYTTPQRIADVWPKRFSLTNPAKKDPNDYLGQPEKLGEAVYFGRMGNNITGDGYKYRGRGLMMLTGKDNYIAFKDFYNNNYQPPIDPVANPDAIINDFTTSVLSAMFFFKKHVLEQMTIDDNTDIEKVTFKINGGNNGGADRKQKLADTKNNINCH